MRKVIAMLLGALLVIPGLSSPAIADELLPEFTVTLNAPEGIPVYAELDGTKNLVVSKQPEGTSTTVAVPGDKYTINTPDVVWKGKRYTPSTESITPEDKEPQTTGSGISISWELAKGAQDFIVTNLSEDNVSFAWTSTDEEKHTFVLRRNDGDRAPRDLTEGRAVPNTGTSASDTTVAEGSTYAYTLFDNGIPVFSLVVGTPDASAEINQSFVREYAATFLNSAVEWEPGTEEGSASVAWPTDIPLPLPGAGVVLAPSETLPFGFLGVVSELSMEGRRVHLVPGGFGDVLAYMDALSKDYPTGNPFEENGSDDTIPGVQQPTGPSDDNVTTTRPPAPKKDIVKKKGKPTKLPNTGDLPTLTCNPAEKNDESSPSPDTKPENQGPKGSFSSKVQITQLDPKIDAWMNFKLDNYKWFVPTEAQMKMYAALTVTGKADLSVSGSVSCTPFKLKTAAKTVWIGGVPLAVTFSGKVSASLSGEGKLKGIGFESKRGFEVNITAGVSGVHADSRADKYDKLLPPESIEGNAQLKFSVGGNVLGGFGIAEEHYGAVAGVSADVKLLELIAKLQGTATKENPMPEFCGSFEGKGSLEVGVEARAWVSFWRFKGEAQAKHNFKKLEWTVIPKVDIPAGCSTKKKDKLTSDIIGSGLTESGTKLSGADSQIGRVKGFVKGQETWVLSTGNVADAVGDDPGRFASTDLKQKGDAVLSGLASVETYDAVTFRTTVVPQGKKIFVRYVFASEEYPEYVGSEYNDILTIKVNGKDCAYIPGTSLPVAVNNVNQFVNSQYFIDNSTGAAGYGTTMDGLTVPLTCEVPVTPGQPTEVLISMADGSDGIYDSAVALLDKGIWSE